MASNAGSESDEMMSPMRLYGASIGIVSGLYSIWLSLAGRGMGIVAWFMLLLGIVVLVHGFGLVTALGDRLGRANGPLMVGYATLMLLVQAVILLSPVRSGSGMSEMGDGMEGMQHAGGMLTNPDPGMVALALLMLASGAIMSAWERGEHGMSM